MGEMHARCKFTRREDYSDISLAFNRFAHKKEVRKGKVLKEAYRVEPRVWFLPKNEKNNKA
jgi:hypothetical protein